MTSSTQNASEDYSIVSFTQHEMFFCAQPNHTTDLCQEVFSLTRSSDESDGDREDEKNVLAYSSCAMLDVELSAVQ